ncbi:hypothetical protein Taro_055244 [Colocasia esculenta]|uniref:Uncharacterized protein n=1 Tax=Colocasia esculenta TaxID=4460 RepID=A0A843XTL6_COLES|nr:hypothetical protein [Colocasia esculenta]
MSFWGRKTFVSHSEIAILADDLPYSKRLPRLRESLAEPTRGAAQSQRSEVMFNSTRDLLPSSNSLDYANCWRSLHGDPPSHSDRKSCSTRHEISSPGRGYGSDSLDYANRWRTPYVEPPSHSDRKSCSTLREISSPGQGYGCLNIADIVTPSGLFPPLQRKNWA